MSNDSTIDLAGTFLPVNTPFDAATGDIDVVAFRENLSRWFEHPIKGILIAGSTGESVFLDEAERRALIEAAADVAPSDRLVIAGTGSESTRHTIHLTQQAAAAGAGAVLVSPPAYFKGAMTADALERHFTAVADASPVPVLIYQVPPKLSTLILPTELIVALSRHPNIVGLKDSRGQLESTVEWVQATADSDFHVLVGSGAILAPALEAGATGWHRRRRAHGAGRGSRDLRRLRRGTDRRRTDAPGADRARPHADRRRYGRSRREGGGGSARLPRKRSAAPARPRSCQPRRRNPGYPGVRGTSGRGHRLGLAFPKGYISHGPIPCRGRARFL